MKLGFLVLGLVFVMPFLAHAENEAVLWEALRRGEAIAIVRHALAPGTGDPANFELGDCSTQRNLSAEGREQARQIGERFRRQGMEGADLYSSEWCRCQDTAAEFGLGEVRDLPSLNSFFSKREQREPQMAALRTWLSSRSSREPLILVTHQVNISALTGVYPRSGEIVVFRWEDGEAQVLGRL